MSNIFKIGNRRNINSTINDLYLKTSLTKSNNIITEYDIDYVLKETEQFQKERLESQNYQIYGNFDFLSILNNLNLNYTTINELFTRRVNDEINNKSIYNSLKLYLVKPSEEYLSKGNGKYERKYEIITKLNEIDINVNGFGLNIYGFKKHNIIINKTIDLSDNIDGLSLPINELYLYCEYIPNINGNGNIEKIYKKKYNYYGNDSSYDEITTNGDYNVGDIINGDIISFDLNNFLVKDENLMEYKIETFFNEGLVKFKYRPFLKIIVNKFSNDINTASVSGSTYDDIVSIPTYAKPLDDNNTTFIWRNLLDKGFIDPLDGDGINFPFLNNKHYVFNDFILNIKPDLNDENTRNIFNEIKYSESIVLSNNPVDNLNEFGKPCK